ncbi:hypothetical protein J5N97_007423 [Dioscorea zingiberensis]|uniref:NmrA-like domain-containing protein n=1 Tax=Dioscorea zingiberensis TaxID=325984 RepID=A0A9D5DF10_9LILI|nr:hypothetical protein J5N97_007423 [Dioscorea zingiberensis]
MDTKSRLPNSYLSWFCFALGSPPHSYIHFSPQVVGRPKGLTSNCPRVLTRSSMAEEKSKILIIGGTGYIGKFIVHASVKLGHPTFVLVRSATASDPAKAELLSGFKSAGVSFLYGELYDHESLVKAIKQVDVVISTVGFVQMQLADQTKIIDAIKEAGNIKRFFPSEFGFDADRSNAVEPVKSTYAVKSQIRRAVEASGIGYTFFSCNYFAGYALPTLGQAGGPPTDKIVILGDGNPKAIVVAEEDIAMYTIKSVDDPRTLNKNLYLRPPGNIYSHNELVALWEKKTGKTLEKIYVPEDEVLKQIQESPMPLNIMLAFNHAIFVKGDSTNFEIDPSFGVEASQLYPDVKYTSIDELINHFI